MNPSLWAQRFWSRVNKNGPIPENPSLGRCWLWTGVTSGKHWNLEYGRVHLHGKLIGSHVASYRLHRGEIPQGKELDHLCRNPMCLNPDHLEAVTHRVNCLRGARSAARKPKSHCRRGHPYEPGSFVCEACKRVKALRHYYKVRDEYNATRRKRRALLRRAK